MAERDIVQNLISRLGQSQDERHPVELGAHFADVEERGPAELLQLWKRLAPLVRFYNATGAESGDWAPFFAYDAAQADLLASREDGGVTPHLALLAAFARLYEIPRAALNRLTGRHLDFFYRRVLRFAPRPPVPDRAHLLIELKKGAGPVLLRPDHAFSAGKEASGVERIYAPVGETVVRGAKVESLRSVFVDHPRDRGGRSAVRVAPVAASADGLGAPLPPAEPRWKAFGHPGLPEAEIGFAVAAPVLRLREGRRQAAIDLRLRHERGTDLTEEALAASFQAFLTGPKGWLGPFTLSASLVKSRLRLTVDVPEDEAAVVDYNPAVHGYAYAAEAPVLQLLLRPGGPLGYDRLAALTVRSVRVEVEVAGLTSLELSGEAGTLDPKKAFLPFGPQPGPGARFQVGCTEAFAKNLSEVRLRLGWQGAPASFREWYGSYARGAEIHDGWFTAKVSFQDGGTWRYAGVHALLEPRDEAGDTVLAFRPGSASASPAAPAGQEVWELWTAGSAWARGEALRKVQAQPVLAAAIAERPALRPGVLAFTLEQGFLHADHRKESIAHLVRFTQGAAPTLVELHEPYTPTLQGIELSYKAHSGEVDVAAVEPGAFAGADVRLFHLGPFGPRREHSWLRRQLPFVPDPRVSLLPRLEHKGELLIGLSGLAAGDGVSLLFQVAEGSADPELPRQTVEWAVLCDNHWKALSRAEITRDTTRNLLTSGVVGVVLPAETTRDNTFLPAGRVWLRAGVRGPVEAVSQLLAVAADAVEVELVVGGTEPAHLASPLPAGTIARLKTPLAPVKALKQPYASFGGRPAEPDEALRTRAAERLRHRNRCLSPWDYERIVLDAFPNVHKVKCIPHAKEGSWLAPGHVLVVVVPDLRNRNAVDPLRPRVDADTLGRIAEHLARRAGPQVRLQVRNPRYQPARLDFKLRLRPGYEFNAYRGEVEQALIRFLSPWAFDAARPISFGGKVYRSVLLDFVEELAPVDFVTDFRMFAATDAAGRPLDVPEIQAATPDAILVSAPFHTIVEV